MAFPSRRLRRFSTRREVALGLGVYAAYLLVRRAVFLLFPVAPPRTLDEFVDTIEEVGGVDLDRGFVAQLYDPIAAMPSIHVAYAVVTAAGIAATSESELARTLAPAYPPLVAAVGFATA